MKNGLPYLVPVNTRSLFVALVNRYRYYFYLNQTTVVLRIRDVYPGSEYLHPGSWIRNKEFKYI